MLVPIDSTVTSLTRKLFWEKEYHQVKLLNGINLTQGNPTECLIHFCQEHVGRFATTLNSMIPGNNVGVMDRGFASWVLLNELNRTQTRFGGCSRPVDLSQNK